MNTGRPWVNLLSRVMAHLVIILACVLVVLLICDYIIKGEMSFLANAYSKLLILALCIIAGINSVIQLSSLNRLRALRRYMRLKARRER